MTTPNERKQSLKNINEFLMDVAYMRKREDRIEMIRRLLRHYPSNMEIDLYWKEEAPEKENAALRSEVDRIKGALLEEIERKEFWKKEALGKTEGK